MMNKAVNQQPVSNDIFVVILIATLFTAINVVHSTQYGRLAVPPTYDDIGYIANGLSLLDVSYQRGWGQWILEFFTKTWHAPITALQASLAFAVFGKVLWAPYLLNGLYLLFFLSVLRTEFRSASAATFFAISLGILAWPLMGHLIVELRPDIPTNLLLALGTWRLANQHEQIGHGEHRHLMSIWKLSWPFIAALWLKPSFSPVVLGLWLSAWLLLCAMNHLVLTIDRGLQNTLASLGGSAGLLFICFLPYLIVAGPHLGQYYLGNVFSEKQDVWSLPLSMVDNLNYYVFGEAGWVTMRWWSVVAITSALIALLTAIRLRDYKSLRMGLIYAAFAFVAWAGMTILKNKSPWFGSLVTCHFLGIFLISTAYILKSLRKAPVMLHLSTGVLVFLGTGLHVWPSSSGALPSLAHYEIPEYSREAKRVYTDICDAIQRQTGDNKVTILVPVISTTLNPDLIELCGFVRASVPIDAPRIYLQPYSQLMTSIRSNVESGERDILALVLSADSPGIPGNLPTSKYMGSIREFFSSSRHFERVAVIRGPNGAGYIEIFRKIAAFAQVENVFGMKGFEGPYPDKKLPIVRWSLFPETQFDLAVPRGSLARLTLEGMPATDKIIANVRLSTGEQTTCEFRASIFRECHLEFSAQTDSIHVAIVPRSVNQLEPKPGTAEAILFSRIEVRNLARAIPNGANLRESSFSHIDFVNGFGSLEGPYKQWDLPVVIWGRGDFSTIGIAGARENLAMLHIEWRPGEAVQEIEIVQGDVTIGRCSAGDASNSFRHCRVPLPTGATPSELLLRYVGDKQVLANKMHNSALFKRIQLVKKND
jgi:hypothetical protein